MATASAAATATGADLDVDASVIGHGVVLSGRGLEKTYGSGAPVLRGVDIVVRPRERVALIGANGAGKSTLLRCLVGLEPLCAGEVTALGERFGQAIGKRAQKRIARRIGFVFQRHGLVRRASALTNVLHGMLGRPGGWRAISHVTAPAGWRADALAALGEVQLEEKALDRADRLSGGQAQRVAVARAILRRPPLLIADEPAASLDPVAGHEVMALFSRLAVEHEAALLFTSHDMDHAVAYADRVVALKGGRTLFDLPSAAVDPARLRSVFDD